MEVIKMDKLVVRFPVRSPMRGQEPLVVDGTTMNLDLSIRTQREDPLHTSTVPAGSGPGNRMYLDASVPQVRSFKTSTVRIDDRSASPVPEVGRVLRNRYVLERRLGSGGIGTVFKAMDRYRCDLAEDNR